jgi:hypothetical protein
VGSKSGLRICFFTVVKWKVKYSGVGGECLKHIGTRTQSLKARSILSLCDVCVDSGINAR